MNIVNIRIFACVVRRAPPCRILDPPLPVACLSWCTVHRCLSFWLRFSEQTYSLWGFIWGHLDDYLNPLHQNDNNGIIVPCTNVPQLSWVSYMCTCVLLISVPHTFVQCTTHACTIKFMLILMNAWTVFEIVTYPHYEISTRSCADSWRVLKPFNGYLYIPYVYMSLHVHLMVLMWYIYMYEFAWMCTKFPWIEAFVK